MPPWELEELIAKKKAKTLKALEEPKMIEPLQSHPIYQSSNKDVILGCSTPSADEMWRKINELVDKVNELTAIVEGKK